MKTIIFIALIVAFIANIKAQVKVDLSQFKRESGTALTVTGNTVAITWPTQKNEKGKILFDLEREKSLFKAIQLSSSGKFKSIAENLDPAFILTVGKRDLVSQNGWNIFFDKTSKLPSQAYRLKLNKTSAAVRNEGSRTIISISEAQVGNFKGRLEITLYAGSPLFNVAAVMSTEIDSTAIIYDAGLVSNSKAWDNIYWSGTDKKIKTTAVNFTDTSTNVAVKYRTIIGENKQGSLAVFPAPHQYFYPLDEAFNLKFTWYGSNYRNLIPEYGIGIRQDLKGDKRFVPWFNAPPKTHQRLNFFCLLSNDKAPVALAEVKKFTHDDSFATVKGYKTMASHFHNEYVMKVLLAKNKKPDSAKFVQVLKDAGLNIIHLGEFHYTAHPKGPDEQRLLELKTLFDMCKKHSDKNFLLLPGEEPNEFFGGHWLDFFPKPVYWIMSRKPEAPFVTEEAGYGKVYRIADKTEMLKLLEAEKGLAWTAHARTKGSTGYPDKYKEEEFFKSDRFFGAAWKAMPADLSLPKLGLRVLDLMDDMANWGLKKHAIAEADLFTITPENEMYAHLNVNYLQLDKLPDYNAGWQPVLDAMQQGKFFVSTGEVLLPAFNVNGKKSGETLKLDASGKAVVNINVDWTFPLNFAEIISGDGKEVYREKVNLNKTKAFGSKNFSFPVNLKNQKWVRVEVWDAAANGAFTQFVWLE